MNRFLLALPLLAAAFTLGLPRTAASADDAGEARALVVADYTVFVDPPTGFVFVKLPQKWQFVGKVEPQDLARLPVGVVTSLLVRDDSALAAVPASSPPR